MLAWNADEKRCCSIYGGRQACQRSIFLNGFHGMLNGRVLGVL